MKTIVIDDTYAGKKGTTTYTIKNTDAHNIEYRITQAPTDEDLSITNFPKTLKPGQSAEVSITFSPKPNRRSPLSEVLRYEEIIG